jgi:hypothetical protein
VEWHVLKESDPKRKQDKESGTTAFYMVGPKTHPPKTSNILFLFSTLVPSGIYFAEVLVGSPALRPNPGFCGTWRFLRAQTRCRGQGTSCKRRTGVNLNEWESHLHPEASPLVQIIINFRHCT